MTIDKSAIRHAATVIVLRDRASDPHVLMGQRGAQAAFMPNKFVFPGGALDAADADVPLAAPLPPICAERLTEDSATDLLSRPCRRRHSRAVGGNRPDPWHPRRMARPRPRRLDRVRRHRPPAQRRCPAIRVPRHHAAGPPAPL